MVKHTQTIRRRIAEELSVFDHFAGLVLIGLKRLLRSLLKETWNLWSSVMPNIPNEHEIWWISYNGLQENN